MPRFNLWSRSAPRAEIDQRSREARIRFERTDEFFIVRRTVTRSRNRTLGDCRCNRGHRIRRIGGGLQQQWKAHGSSAPW